MRKTILYRLFRLGAIPRKLRPTLEKENIVVSDEGISGRLITKDVMGPGKRYLHRSEGFSGCLVLTEERLICFTFWNCQINISINDPKVSEIYVDALNDYTLSLSFESSVFRDGWQGVIEFQFKTEKALRFCDTLISVGARQGVAPGSGTMDFQP